MAKGLAGRPWGLGEMGNSQRRAMERMLKNSKLQKTEAKSKQTKVNIINAEIIQGPTVNPRDYYRRF